VTSSFIPACNGGLLRHPASRLLQFSRRKKLYWRAADSCSGKGERKGLPTWLTDDGDLGNLTAVRDQKVEIIPIGAALPALKVFENDEQARFRSGVDLARKCALLCIKFGSFQNPADA
jgi:hypothetical protein